MPDGRITQKTGMFVADSLVQKVPLRSSQTPATRLGVLPELALVLLAAGGLGWAVSGAVRARRDAGTATAGSTPAGTTRQASDQA
jgi:apolipoprotein N-acyltransferase